MRAFAEASVVGLGALLFVAGCSGAESSQGSDLGLRIRGAQLVGRELPEADGGPRVTLIDFRRSAVVAGESGIVVSGRTEGTGYAVNVTLEGQRGYWIVPTGVEDPAVEGELTWSTALDFSRNLPPGEARLLVQASNERGRVGEPRGLSFDIETDAPQGALYIELSWDVDADVDLIVTDPNGISISSKNINSYEPPGPGQPRDPMDAYLQGCRLDVDSNANCLIDGRRREAAVWATAAPEGRYQLRVDLASPCGKSRVSYTIRVIQDAGGDQERVISESLGVLYPTDALQTENGDGIGVWAAEFEFDEGDTQ
jgi:hypothetical protein